MKFLELKELINLKEKQAHLLYDMITVSFLKRHLEKQNEAN
jgi:hypothetical protein